MSELLKEIVQSSAQRGSAMRHYHLVYTPSQEQFAQALAKHFPMTVTFEAHVLTLESQQQDEALNDAAADAIAKLADPPRFKTGAAVVYLLDGKSLAAGDGASQELLNAATANVLQDPANTILALLPADHPEVLGGVQNVSAGGIADVLGFLTKSTEARVVTSMEELIAALSPQSDTSGGL